MEERELPAGWIYANLDTVVSLKTGPFGSSLHKSDYVHGETPVVNPMHITNGSIVPDLKTTVGQSVLDRLREFKLQEGDVVLGRRGEMGRAAVVRMPESGWLCGTGSLVLRHFGALESDYLQRFLSSPFVVMALEGASVGSTMVNLNQGILKSLEIPIPPLNEQRRIAAKLDTTLAAVESCRQRLDGVADLLKRFRQAVLAAATSGELTREWREERGISQEWNATTFGAACEYITVGYVGKMADQYVSAGIPFLRSLNVRPFRIEEENLAYISQDFHRTIGKSALAPGDLAVVRTGAPGQCCVIPDSLAEANCSDLVIARPGPDLFADYGAIVINSSLGQGFVKSEQVGVAQAHFNVGSMKRAPLSLPSVPEQQEIVRRAQDLFTLADQLEARLTSARKVVDRLTPALLAKAFRGELVPQDPSDEPASALLQRLQAARQAEAGARKPSRRGRKPAAAHPEQARLGLASRPSGIASTASDPAASDPGASDPGASEPNAADPAPPLPPDLLTSLLQECGPLSDRALLAASELEPVRFATQLALERQAGRLQPSWENGEARWAAVG